MRLALPLILVLGLAYFAGYQALQLSTYAAAANADAPADRPFVGVWEPVLTPDARHGIRYLVVEEDGRLIIVPQEGQRGPQRPRLEAEWWIDSEHRIRFTTIRADRTTEGEIDFSVPDRLLMFPARELPYRFERVEDADPPERPENDR